MIERTKEEQLRTAYSNVESSLEEVKRWVRREEERRSGQPIVEAKKALENFSEAMSAKPMQKGFENLSKKLKAQVLDVMQDPALATALGTHQAEEFMRKLTMVYNLLSPEASKGPKGIGQTDPQRPR